ncbi:MAG: hypothetical protein IPJ16_05775 [Bacteroidales bacterium]|nr:hypothetical protein [Bacteroidales bacterium]
MFLKLSHPYRVFSVSWIPSWLVPFKKVHPGIIQKLISDISSGVLQVELRPKHDIDKLVNSFTYRIGIIWLKFIEPFDMAYYTLKRKAKSSLKTILKKFSQ